MARKFVAASSQKIVYSGTPGVTAYPITMSCWFKPTSAVGSFLIGFGGANPSSASGYLGLVTVSDGTVRMQTDYNSSAPSAEVLPNSGATTLSNGTWYRLTAVWTNDTRRDLYVGNTKFTDTNSEAFPQSVNSIGIGHLPPWFGNASASNFADGEIADAAIWNVALSDADVAQLVAGAAADQVQPNGLIHYYPLSGRASPEPDIVGKYEGTVTGATQSDHPRIVETRRAKIGMHPPASFTATPTSIYTSAGDHTFTLTGYSTDWQSNPATFTVSGGTTTKTSQNITSDVSATLVLNIGTAGTVTISDGTREFPFTVGAAALSVVPGAAAVSETNVALTFTGTNTVWTQDNPTFTLSGGTGASIGATTVVTDTSATATLTSAGSTVSTLTLTDPDTGATDTIDVGASVPDAPTIGTATGGNASATVAFTPPGNNGGSAITSYTATSTPGSITGSGASSPVTVTGLTNGTNYTFTVHATNNVGNSAESAASNSTLVATVPGPPTAVSAHAWSGGFAEISFTAPADNGGSAVTGYTVTSSLGQTASGASSPITISGLTAAAQTFTVKATNAIGDSIASSASGSVTPGGGCATFDGSGSTYLKRTIHDALKTMPFWMSAWVRHARDPDYDTVYCVVAAEKADGTNGTCGFIMHHMARSQVADGTSFTHAVSEQSVIPSPYWDHLIFEFRSSTDYRVYINGVEEGAATTSRVINLSSGSPEFRIGRRTSAAQYMDGDIANVLVGSGTLRAADRTILGTIGADYSTVAPTGGAAVSWYPLAGNGYDVIGGLDLTDVGAVVYSTDGVEEISSPTTDDVVYEVFKQTTHLANSPTVVTGQASPVSTAGWTNLADVEWINLSWTGNVSAWNTRVYHYVPTTSLDHLVFLDGGHAYAAAWASYNTDDVIQQLVAEGYAVAVTQMPAFSPVDPLYTGGAVDHNTQWASYTANANPLERFLGPNAIALNNLAGRYTKRSIVGLSGGGWRAVHYGAMDPRINHAIVCVRGSIADRRNLGSKDFEQCPLPNGWKVEEFYRLCAKTNRRLWLVHHPNDDCCFGIDDAGTYYNSGAYLDATDYDTTFLAPIRAIYPYADVQFIVDQGAAPHAFTQWTIDNAIIPALETDLEAIPGGSIVINRRRRRI